VTRLNKLVKDGLGTSAGPYCVGKYGKRPLTRYGLTMSVEMIAIKPSVSEKSR
jgi:hypothetical protein